MKRLYHVYQDLFRIQILYFSCVVNRQKRVRFVNGKDHLCFNTGILSKAQTFKIIMLVLIQKVTWSYSLQLQQSGKLILDKYFFVLCNECKKLFIWSTSDKYWMSDLFYNKCVKIRSSFPYCFASWDTERRTTPPQIMTAACKSMIYSY